VIVAACVLSAIRNNALKQVTNRIRHVIELNTFICLFMGVSPFCLVVCSFAIRYPNPGNSERSSPKNFKTTEFSVLLRQPASAQGYRAAGAKWGWRVS
jgi:hypothetical protein